MSLSATRFGANATPLPGPAPLPPISVALSRRAALFGAVSVAGITAAVAVPARGQTAALSADDARLVAMAAELRTVLADTAELVDDDPRDCEDIPGFLALENRRMEISAALFEVSPSTKPPSTA